MSKLRDQLEQHNIEDISYCNCGAYTVTINGKQYSVHQDNFFNLFPNVDQSLFKRYVNKILMNHYSNCNHCVNHWGLDLCACGSGELVNECNEELEECGQPIQSIQNEYTHVRGKNAWK